jgi:hypothetical protein
VTTGLLTDGIDGVVDLSLLPSNVVVTAQTNDGTIWRTTVPKTQTGEFFLGSLAEFCTSSPCLYNVVITADGYPAAVIAAVPVASNSITTISTTTARFMFGTTSISHSISGNVTLQTNPATDEATVVVGAQQTLNSGLTATIKSQVATASTSTTGDYGYSLTLPVGATLLGQYSTTLPISLSATTAAGIYNVTGSASVLDSTGDTTTFATQNPSPLTVNITGGDATNQNFTLQ